MIHNINVKNENWFDQVMYLFMTICGLGYDISSDTISCGDTDIIENEIIIPEERNLKYDVFIVSSFKDRAFAEGILSQLEENHYKVCYSLRDFVPGRRIMENIDEHITISRHVLCLLSVNFLESGYCVQEFVLTHQKDSSSNSKQLLVLMIENITCVVNKTRIPELRNYLKEYTCIEHANEIWFNQLMRAIPSRIEQTNIENQLPVNLDECEGEDMIYDVFISSSNEDQICTEDILRRLESRYKVCYHKRDFTGGVPIMVNIEESISKSRRMLCLLSKHYTESEFCKSEFLLARTRDIEMDKRRLLVWMIDEMVTEKCENIPEIRDYLKLFTYIHNENKMGFDQLVYAMPIKVIET